MKKIILLLIALAFIIVPAQIVYADSDPRYCGTPKRYANGKIKRSTKELARFARWHKCPSNGKYSYRGCKDWQINHIIPLACGGCDNAENMEWAHKSIKTCAKNSVAYSPSSGKSWKVHCIDRYERKIYAHDPPFAGTENCVSEIVNK